VSNFTVLLSLNEVHVVLHLDNMLLNSYTASTYLYVGQGDTAGC